MPKNQRIAVPTPSTTITIRLPLSLKQQIEATARAQDRSVANFIVRCLRAFVSSIADENPCSSAVDTCSEPTGIVERQPTCLK
jgi:hypothetical protein